MSNEVTPETGKESVASGGLKDVPKAPSGVRAMFLTPTSVRLDWLTGVGTTSIQIKRKVGLTAAQLIATVDAAVSSFLDHLSGGAGGPVSYELIALNEKGAAQPVTIEPEKAATDSAGESPPNTATDAAPPSTPLHLKAAVTGSNTVTLTWTGEPARYEVRRSIGGGLIQAIGQTVEGVFRFIDQLPPMPWAKSQSIVYVVVALAGGAPGSVAAATAKQASVTVTIDPPKAAVDPSSPEGEVDSLPRVRARTP
jgi:hypothetical protein